MPVLPRRPFLAIASGLLLAAGACSTDDPDFQIPAQSDGLTILPAQKIVAVGDQPLQLTAQFRQAGQASFLAPSQVQWSVSAPTASAPGAAAVSAEGLLTAVTRGATTITATYTPVAGGTTYTATAPVLVKPRLVAVQFSPTAPEVGTDAPVQVRAVALYEDHSALEVTADTAFSLEPASPPVATLSGNTLTAVAAGAARLTGVYHGFAFSAPVTTVVSPPAPTPAALASVAVTPAAIALAQATSLRLAATAGYADASTQDVTGDAVFASSDDAVVAVEGALVRAVAPGSATITATYAEGGVEVTSAPVAVTVTGATLTGLAIVDAAAADPLAAPALAAFTVPLDGSRAVKAIGTFNDGTKQDVSRDVAWDLANAAADDAGVHADLTPGGSALLSAVTPPAFDPPQYTAGDVIVTATFTQADGNAFEPAAELPVAVTDQPMTAVGTLTDGVITVEATWPDGTVNDISSRVVYWVTDGTPSGLDGDGLLVDNLPGGDAQGTVSSIGAGGTVQLWFVPTADSVANGWQAGVPFNVGQVVVAPPAE